jgi:hypothetical protein
MISEIDVRLEPGEGEGKDGEGEGEGEHVDSNCQVAGVAGGMSVSPSQYAITIGQKEGHFCQVTVKDDKPL